MLLSCENCSINFISNLSDTCTKCKSTNIRNATEEEMMLYGETYLPFFDTFDLEPSLFDILLNSSRTRVLFNPSSCWMRRLGYVIPNEKDLEYVEMFSPDTPAIMDPETNKCIKLANRFYILWMMKHFGYEMKPEAEEILLFRNRNGKTIRLLLYPPDMKLGKIILFMASRCHINQLTQNENAQMSIIL
jgi:hypothetical protein